MHAWFRSLGWSATDADDAVQEVFLRAWKEHRMLGEAASPAAWLFRTARNLANDGFRIRIRETRRHEESVRRSRPDGGDPPERRLEIQELHARVLAAIDRLPEPLRAVLLLKKTAGLTHDEVAQVLDIPAGTVASRLWAAVRRVAAWAEEDVAPSPVRERTIP